MQNNQVRIIGGKWRGRKLKFPGVPMLRPTPNRVRETLFNWLAPIIAKSRCLDLFAGSGSSSFEALSRGASSVVALEQNPVAIAALQDNARLLKAENLQIIPTDCLQWLQANKLEVNNLQENNLEFDVIFVDPPFAKKLLSSCFTLIAASNCLKQNGLVYFESDENLAAAVGELPLSWKILREKKAGKVYYGLIQVP